MERSHRDHGSLSALRVINEKGRAKVLLGVAVGRKKADKREAIKQRDWQREKSRLLSSRGKFSD